jgi:hypothetical protein
VWRRYVRETEVPSAGTDGEKPLSPLAKSMAEVRRLQEEPDAANAAISRLKHGQDNLTEGRDWTWQDPAKEIAAAMFRAYPTKASQLGSALMHLSNSTSQKRPRKRKPCGSSEA